MNGIILTNTPNPDCDSTASNALAGLSPPHCMMHHDAELRLGRPRPPSVGLSCSSGRSSPLHDAERFGVDESGGRVLCIEEKPQVPASHFGVAGEDMLRAGVMVESEMGKKNEVRSRVR